MCVTFHPVRFCDLNKDSLSIISSPGGKCSIYDANKVYLGVRVKMPVRDLLKNIRIAQGWRPQDSQVIA